MKFKIIEQREIISGFYSETFIVEAENKEEALEKLRNQEENEEDIEYDDVQFDIRDSEHLYFEDEY